MKSMNEIDVVELSQVLDNLELQEPAERPREVRVRFLNPDVDYLVHKLGMDHRFVGRMLRTFGEPVVLESLRRMQFGWSEAVFFGICRNVELAGVSA